MKNNKKQTNSTYMSRHLTDLENMPVNEETLYLVDAITSIDRSLYRKDWFNVYKKCKRVVEHMEKNIGINEEENHYFLHCSSLVDSLYLTAYTALTKVYFDMVSVNDDELDSMDEFIATVKDKYGETIEDIAPAPSRISAYNRLMNMTRPMEVYQQSVELENISKKLTEAHSNLETVLNLLRFDGYSKSIKEPLIEEVETLIASTQSSINSAQTIVMSDTLK